MKCFVYILKNKEKKYYVGITKLLPSVRLERHNNGDVYSTKFGSPWQLIYFEEYNGYEFARNREVEIKSWHGGNAFRKFITKVAGSSNW